MKNIAIFQKDLGLGGIQKSLINLLSRLSEYNIDLYLFEKDVFFEIKLPSNVNIIYLKKFKAIYKVIPFNMIVKLKKFELNKKYDVAIDFNGYSNECAIGALNVISNKKIIWCHNDIIVKYKNEFKYRILYNKFKNKYNYFDMIVTVSEGAMNSFINKTKINKEKVLYISNYIDTEEIIQKSKETVALPIDDKKYNLIAVGRICKQKGFDILIKHMEKIVKKNKDVILYIIGEGPDKKRVQRAIIKSNIAKNVFLLGSQKNPYKYMNKMDGLVLTSRYEGQGMVVLEALTLGLNVFVTENLKEYLPEIKVTKNIELDILNAKKREKKINNLEEYNKKIDEKIRKIIEGE